MKGYTELQKLEKLKITASQTIRSIKKLEKLSNTDTSEMSMKASHNLRDKRLETGEYIEQLEHEIHCLVVELGLAKKEDWRYGQFENSGNGWSRQAVYRREPKV